MSKKPVFSSIEDRLQKASPWVRYILPGLALLSFLLNFTSADVGTVSNTLDTALTPPPIAFTIWLDIYVLELIFLLYQLFSPRARNSRLVQQRLCIPFIIHQVLTACWLHNFGQFRITLCTVILFSMWILDVFMFASITSAFRTGSYHQYGVKDYIFIEIPFATLLGWESLATLLMFNLFAVDRSVWLGSLPIVLSAQILAFIISLCIITAAAILFAGLPMVMDPFLHLPIIWGTFLTARRLSRTADAFGGDRTAPHLAWLQTAGMAQGLALSLYVVCGITTFFFIVAAAILAGSRFCLPDREGTSAMLSESQSANRSPRTARSALSAEEAAAAVP